MKSPLPNASLDTAVAPSCNLSKLRGAARHPFGRVLA